MLSCMCTCVCTCLYSRKSYLNISPPTVCAYWTHTLSSLLSQTVHLMHHFHICRVCLIVYVYEAHNRFFPSFLSGTQIRYIFSEGVLKSHQTFTFLLLRGSVWESFAFFSTMRIYDPASTWLTAVHRSRLPNFISPQKMRTPLVVYLCMNFKPGKKNKKNKIQNLFILNHKCGRLHRKIVRLCFPLITVHVQNKK